MTLRKIGRFKVGKTLGAGNQGTVYLCGDSELRRKVAIKLLDKTQLGSRNAEADFKREARTISQLQHPNIVSIYEVGKHRGTPYLVFEYVEGKLLSELIAEGLGMGETLEIFQAILEGIERAHRQGIVHRDLKPANIIVNAEGVPKIMDFGIARFITGKGEVETRRIGTPRYMAPEYIERGQMGPESDVFSLGAILSEMLTGSPAFKGTDQQTVLANVVGAPVPPPSGSNREVDDTLDGIVLRAVEKDPTLRFSNAGDLLESFRNYRESRKEQDLSVRDEKSTIDFLLRRMRRKSDFPALSQSISILNQLISTQRKDVSAVAGVIIKDFALTNKILKVVNSAYYSSFAGKVGTISRAIVVLGMDAIRSIAASLILFEHLHDKSQAGRLKEQISSSLFSAVLARQTADDAGFEQVEESFLCAMFYNLGEILVTYYLHDESEEIRRLMEHEGVRPTQAQHTVLGATFEQIGVAVAKQWNFPRIITKSMQRPKETRWKRPQTPEGECRIITCFANEVTQTLATQEEGEEPPVAELLERYRDGLKFNRKQFDSMVSQAAKEFTDLRKHMGGRQEITSFLQKLCVSSEPATEPVISEKRSGDAEDIEATLTLQPVMDPEAGFEEQDESSAAGPDPMALLTDGLQEVTNALLEESTVGQIFNVVLESMYRSRLFTRVLLCLRDARVGQFIAKKGFGNDIEGYLERFRFSAQYSANVFHISLEKGVDIHIDDTGSETIQTKLPGWYREFSDAGSFLVFPLMLKQRAVGFIYVDHMEKHALELDSKVINMLKTLRNQAVMAVRNST